jgi:hypothetical protein
VTEGEQTFSSIGGGPEACVVTGSPFPKMSACRPIKRTPLFFLGITSNSQGGIYPLPNTNILGNIYIFQYVPCRRDDADCRPTFPKCRADTPTKSQLRSQLIFRWHTRLVS